MFLSERVKILSIFSEKVKRITAITAKSFPENVEIFFGNDQSKGIKTMLNSLQNNVIAAIIPV
jgi:hypothetical protein